ncbi:MAG: sel1 repeat family protein [Magnetococcales bacterium]|nr:sel1 repeat family protein [Magnetococcales bacterium]MBF0322822.1 sel1 repeat family protein [Magnetococcales bacterium]
MHKQKFFQPMVWVVWIILATTGLGSNASADPLSATLQQARNGHARAQSKLGNMYLAGEGVQKDYVAAMYWFRQAAEQGDAEAQNGIGTLYDNGKGVPRDFLEAARWFRLAARQGHVLARRNLGWMYEKGQGLPKDYVKSYMWQALAEMAHHKKAPASAENHAGMPCRYCASVARHMTREHMEQAQQMARAWQPSTSQ